MPDFQYHQFGLRASGQVNAPAIVREDRSIQILGKRCQRTKVARIEQQDVFAREKRHRGIRRKNDKFRAGLWQDTDNFFRRGIDHVENPARHHGAARVIVSAAGTGIHAIRPDPLPSGEIAIEPPALASPVTAPISLPVAVSNCAIAS